MKRQRERKKDGASENRTQDLWLKPPALYHWATTPTDSHPSLFPFYYSAFGWLLMKYVFDCCVHAFASIITAWGVQRMALSHSLKTDSDCLIEDYLVRYCPAVITLTIHYNQQLHAAIKYILHQQSFKSTIIKGEEGGVAVSGCWGSVALSVFGLWGSHVHRTPHAVITLTIHYDQQLHTLTVLNYANIFQCSTVAVQSHNNIIVDA